MKDVINHIDLETKRIYLEPGTRDFHPVDDLYKQFRYLRATDESYRGFDMPIYAAGNVSKGAGKFTERYATIRHGWKIVPEDTSHFLYVSGGMITDIPGYEAGRYAFDYAPLSPESKVVVEFEPPAAELIETGVSGLTEEESNRLMEVQTIKAKTDKLPSNPADESSVQALSDKIGTPTSPTIADDLDEIEAKSQAIKNKTDGIPPDPAIQSLIEARIAAAFSEIKGAPWTDETLKLIMKKIEDLELQPYPSRAHVRL